MGSPVASEQLPGNSADDVASCTQILNADGDYPACCQAIEQQPVTSTPANSAATKRSALSRIESGYFSGSLSSSTSTVSLSQAKAQKYTVGTPCSSDVKALTHIKFTNSLHDSIHDISSIRAACGSTAKSKSVADIPSSILEDSCLEALSPYNTSKSEAGGSQFWDYEYSEFYTERCRDLPTNSTANLEAAKVEQTTEDAENTTTRFQSPIIGTRKMGTEFLDFVEEFAINSSFQTLVTKIGGYMDPKDLCAMTCVNTTWRQVVHDDKLLNERRLEYIADVRLLKTEVGQENWPIKNKGRTGPRAGNREAFGDIRNFQTPLQRQTSRQLSTAQSAQGDTKSVEKMSSPRWLAKFKEWGKPRRKKSRGELPLTPTKSPGKAADVKDVPPDSHTIDSKPSTSSKREDLQKSPKTDRKVTTKSEKKVKRNGALAGSRGSLKQLRRL